MSSIMRFLKTIPFLFSHFNFFRNISFSSRSLRFFPCFYYYLSEKYILLERENSQKKISKQVFKKMLPTNANRLNSRITFTSCYQIHPRFLAKLLTRFLARFLTRFLARFLARFLTRFLARFLKKFWKIQFCL